MSFLKSSVTAAAWTFSVLSLVVAVFHLAIILGAPWGRWTMGGRWPGVLPPAARWLSLASAIVTALLAYVVLCRAGVIDQTLPGWCMKTLLVYLVLAIPMHIATPSPAERQAWLPVILLMTACAVWVEWQAH